MRWLRTLVLFDKGDVLPSADWQAVHSAYVRSIKSIEHPKGSGALTLRKKSLRPSGQWNRNGVGFLRSNFLAHLVKVEKWKSETIVNLVRDREQPPIMLYPSKEKYSEPITSDFGGFDFTTESDSGLKIAIEWETGNISSSHRSMNKLAIALADDVIQIGVLIVPSRALYVHLTDRIGNIGELSGYLRLWESLKTNVNRGLLAITVVEHDALTDSATFPYLKQGADGRSQKRRKPKLPNSKGRRVTKQKR